jgi:adenylate cyclase
MVKQASLKESPPTTTTITPLEIERKWIVDSLPDLLSITPKFIRQGYLEDAADGSEVRVRECNDKFYLTTKSRGGIVRSESEKEISSEEFSSLWDKTLGHRIEKLRYCVPCDGHIVEIDVYQGHRKGLVIGEVEFLSLRDAERFSPPAWFGQEVTEDSSFKNRILAKAVPAL